MDLVQIHGFEIPSKTQEFRNLSLTHTVSLWVEWPVRVSLPSSNSQTLLPPLSRQGNFRFVLSTLIFLFNLSNSLFLLNLNSKGMWVFLVGLFDLFVGLFGFNLIVYGFCLICLCILFHGIFNDMFLVCFYFLFLFSFVGL